ncbi:hypothetical protein SAMN05216326_10963 [Nitrosomonas marina]|uniref:Cytochrome b561 n=1 Tax=Nitrosomonas marina TaxID=917 RepID=A0A1I0B5A1_9PROT|nr:hypothetical protein [Nitrosomonas marina]SET01678.1 hypothetical protein SAMN05216326_10963 [Nitrosomonas marina]
MQQSIKNIRNILIYTASVSLISLVYFIYAYSSYPVPEERETFLSEVGEFFGKTGLGLLGFIYLRTVLKLMLGQGKLAQRLLPDYQPPVHSSALEQLLAWMNRTHVYFGIAAIAVMLLHISLMDISRYSHILFFPALLVLIVWQGLFGMFLAWRYSPAELKKFSHVVHAQFITGIAIGIFAFFGHILIDD